MAATIVGRLMVARRRAGMAGAGIEENLLKNQF
jgi:hypothetical protein